MNAISAGAAPRQHLDALLHAFMSLGYDRGCIRTDLPLGGYENGRASAEKLELAIFHDSNRHDYRTIAAVAKLDQQALVTDKERGRARAKELAVRSTAPNVVLGGSTTSDIWLDCHDNPIHIRDVPLQRDALERAFGEHRNKLERAALARLRGGQGWLFDRLYEARREDLAEALNQGFAAARESDPRSFRSEDRRALLSAAAIAILAARILEDKGFLATGPGAPPPHHTDAIRLLSAVEARADGFFTKVLKDLSLLEGKIGSGKVNAALAAILAHLTGPVCFSLVTPDMLGHLYESALLPARREGKKSGATGEDPLRPKAEWIHYTPLTLTRHILQRLPVEEIRQDCRLALDMACGSGTFLLAATDRLSALFDAEEAALDRRDATWLSHLRSSVVGYDIDDVALYVTRLTYLVAHWTAASSTDDIPAPRCDKKNAMSLDAETFGERPPTVIVGNPPFQSGNVQLANRFLEKAIDLLAPGGLLGMILPAGFLKMSREQCPATRRRLLDTCDLLEVWEQPLGAVGIQARQETCVILARRRGGSATAPSATLFKQTHSSAGAALRALREHLRSTRTFASSGPPGQPSTFWTTRTDARLIATPVERIWQKVKSGRILGSLCDTVTGIDMVGAPPSAFGAQAVDSMVPYMRHQARLRPYVVHRADWQLDIGEKEAVYNYVDPSKARFRREESWPVLNAHKVIVTLRGNRNNRHQMVGAYDPTFDGAGVFPEDDFGCFSIHPGELAPWAQEIVQRWGPRTVLLWVAALLNGPVAQTWAAAHAAPRGMSLEDLTTMPLPAFDAEIAKIAERIGSLAEFRPTPQEGACWEAYEETRPQSENERLEDLVGYLNHRIILSYGLKKDDASALMSYLREMTEPFVDAPEDAHLARRGVYRRIAGTVVAVDVLDQRLTLELPRYRQQSSISVPLPRHIPGWALTPGIDFTCAVPADSLSADDLLDPWLLRDFMPVPYSYLNTNELEQLIGYARRGEPADEE